MIGDPSGRSTERNLLDVATLEANVAAIRVQLERFLDFAPDSGAVMVNNLDWLGPLSLIEFLRDTGKHFTIPYMLAKDSVQVRLERGLSFTEFSYMLLQSYDFAHLHREYGVELQMGGADQWGNITAGLELIRRTNGLAEGVPAEESGPGRLSRIRPTVSPTSCCSRRRAPSSARARRASRSGWTRRAPRRTRSTSTGSTPTTATSAPTCAGSPSCRATRSRRSRPSWRARPRAGRRSARSPWTSPPGRTARRRRPARSPIPRPSSRPRPSPTRPSWPRSTSPPAGSRSIHRCLAGGSRSCWPRPACSPRGARPGG